MLLEKGAKCCIPSANWKTGVKLHQGWENALVLAVDAPFRSFTGAADRRFINSIPLTRLRYVRERRPAAGVRWWKGGRISVWGLRRAAGAERLWL
jgi:hypothetical protein